MVTRETDEKVSGGKDTKKQFYRSRTHAMAKLNERDQALGMGKP